MAPLIGLIGAVAFLFGLGAYYFTFKPGLFFYANIVGGGGSLLAWGMHSLVSVSRPSGEAGGGWYLRKLGGVVLVVAAVLGLNWTTARYRWRFDTTLRQLYSLSPLTEQVLDGLREPVEALVFERTERDRRVEQLIASYASRSPKFTYRFLDMQREREALGRFGVEEAGLVLRAGSAAERILEVNEHNLTNALIRLTFTQRPLLCLTTGHGEAPLKGKSERAYSGLARALRDQGCNLELIVLNGHTTVQDECGALLILGPQRAFSEDELRDLAAYLDGGGRVLLLVEPAVASGLEPLLERIGIRLGDGMILDPQSSARFEASSGVRPLINYFRKHPITEKFNERTFVQFETVRPVLPAVPAPEGWDVTALAYSSSDSRVIRAAGAADRRDEKPSRTEWVPVAVAASQRSGPAENAASGARVLVIGDADFIANRNLASLYNLDFILNAIHWIAGREPLVSIGPKFVKPYQEILTPEETLSFFYSFAMVLPEAILITGVILWWRRRGR